MRILNTLKFLKTRKDFFFFAAMLLMLTPIFSQGAVRCESIFSNQPSNIQTSYASYNKIVEVMQRGAYSLDKLPVIPLQMFKWIKGRLTFFVAKRSQEILKDTRDYREVGMEKPIHPMGVGLTGTMSIQPSRWSGIFRGGEFPVIARASISQGNPFKYDQNGKMQVRSTAMAIKIFGSHDPTVETKTANAVFQNNLNGLLGNDGLPLNYLESAQTNQPGIDFSKIKHAYEVQTLLGVAYGAIFNKKDHTSNVPFINPQIRPVHSWSEFNESSPTQVRNPVWVKIEPKLIQVPEARDDFRLEIVDTLNRDGLLVYEISAADKQDSLGRIQWEKVGTMTFNQYYLSEGVDKNLLFPHDSLHSKFTGEKFVIPEPSKQFNSVPNDLQ